MDIKTAKALHVHQVVYCDLATNSDGTPYRYRVTGKVKTWKRNENRVKVPVARGLYQHAYITEKNCQHVHLEEEQARNAMQARKGESK